MNKYSCLFYFLIILRHLKAKQIFFILIVELQYFLLIFIFDFLSKFILILPIQVYFIFIFIIFIQVKHASFLTKISILQTISLYSLFLLKFKFQFQLIKIVIAIIIVIQITSKLYFIVTYLFILNYFNTMLSIMVMQFVIFLQVNL